MGGVVLAETPRKSSEGAGRVEALYRQLRDLAYRRGPDQRLPTVLELRDTYGVSQATIAAALQRLEAEDIVRRVARHGIFVSPRLHRKRLLVTMDTALLERPLTSPVWCYLWSLFMREADRRSAGRDEEVAFQLSARTSRPGEPSVEERVVSQLRSGLVHGAISIGRHFEPDPDLPLVVFAGTGHWNVLLDFHEMISLLTVELARRGYRKIALWQPDRRQLYRTRAADVPAEAAWRSIAETELERHGLSLGPDDFHSFIDMPLENTPALFQDQGYELIMDIFLRKTRPRPEVILCPEDMMINGALVALHELGLRPGKDIAIAGHANRGTGVLHGYEKNLILVEFDPARIVTELFSMLDILLSGEQPADAIRYVRPRLRATQENGASASNEVGKRKVDEEL